MKSLLNFFLNDNVVFFCIFCVLFLIAYQYLLTPRTTPPGPIGLPIVGYLPFLGKYPHLTFKTLGEKYGSIFSFFLGSQLVVVLNDYKAVHEAFVKKGDIFSGRPLALKQCFPVPTFKSLTTSDGTFWKEHRKFTQTLLREHGIGTIEMESHVMEEIHKFLDELQRLPQEPADIHKILHLSVANNVSSMFLGKSFDYADVTFLRFLYLNGEMVKSKSSLTPLLFFPWLKYVPGIRQILKYGQLQKMQDEVHDFLSKQIDDERSRHTKGQDGDNYINAFSKEQSSRGEVGRRHTHFSDDALLSNLRATMIAGVETTANTLLWAIIYLLHYPEVQERIHKELDEVIGCGRSPSWNDRLRTPYTEATICEVQRICDLIPLNLPHRNRDKCEVLGYTIPKNCLIISNIANVHKDPRRWNDPERFQPERFLNSDGKVERPVDFIPFSTGKRQCIGEPLAKMELYLYFTSMVQKFTFNLNPKGNLPSLKGHMKGSHTPPNFEVLLVSKVSDDKIR